MAPTDEVLTSLASKLGECLKARKMKLASAESCTGGWLSKAITDIPGSSAWFSGAMVTYSNAAKQSLLGVREKTLAEFGAVSGETVREMAEGIFTRMDADVAISISGIAGPDGGTRDKPVGLVWMAWGRKNTPVSTEFFQYQGDREAVRRQAVYSALEILFKSLECDHSQ